MELSMSAFYLKIFIVKNIPHAKNTLFITYLTAPGKLERMTKVSSFRFIYKVY
jgi:hypothetical protein